MIITIRVPADAKPVLATDRRFNIKHDHPLYETQCPVCDVILGDEECVMILAGIPRDCQKSSGWTTGTGIMVHTVCAGYDVQQ